MDITGKSSSGEAKRRVLLEFFDGSFGVFDFKENINLLTAAYFLSPTDEDGKDKKEGMYLTSPSGSKVKNAVNMDTGAQDTCEFWTSDGQSHSLGTEGSANNLITFVESEDDFDEELEDGAEFKMPPVISRTEWGARSPKETAEMTEYEGDLKSVLTHIVIHHSAFVLPSGPKTLQDVEMDNMGYDDIGYHFVIDKYGNIHEGRALKTMGAHAGQSKEANDLVKDIREGRVTDKTITEARKLDPDYGAIGICLDGYFDKDGEQPTSKQQKSLKRLLAYLKQTYAIPQGNIISHREVKEKIIEKRGLTFEGEETVCPGVNGENVLQRIKKKLPKDTEEAERK